MIDFYIGKTDEELREMALEVYNREFNTVKSNNCDEVYERGLKKGFIKGFIKGFKEGRIRSIVNLSKYGVDVNKISRILNMSVDDVKNIIDNYKY